MERGCIRTVHGRFCGCQLHLQICRLLLSHPRFSLPTLLPQSNVLSHSFGFLNPTSALGLRSPFVMPKEYLNGDLPDELMLEFPKYLDRKDLGHLCMTTPRLRSIVESLYFETVTVRLGRTVSSKDAHADIRGLAATLTKFTRHLLVDVPPQLRAQDLCQALFESMGVTSILSLTFTRSSSLESTASTAISNWFQKSSILSKITLPGSYVANGKKSGRPTAKFTGTLVFGNGSRYLTICFKGGRDGTDVKLLKGAALILGNNKSVEAMILLCKIQPCKIPTLLKGIGLDCSKPLQVPVLSLEGHYYDVLTEGDLNLFDMKSVRQVFLVGYSNPGSFLKRLASAAYSTSSLKEFHFAGKTVVSYITFPY
jgi:hypothetical protein